MVRLKTILKLLSFQTDPPQDKLLNVQDDLTRTLSVVHGLDSYGMRAVNATSAGELCVTTAPFRNYIWARDLMTAFTVWVPAADDYHLLVLNWIGAYEGPTRIDFSNDGVVTLERHFIPQLTSYYDPVAATVKTHYYGVLPCGYKRFRVIDHPGGNSLVEVWRLRG